MARFFIDRPIFAWVIALFIMLAGTLAITRLPISQYPTIAPPSVIVTATYPGASAKILDESVTSLIEQELNGAEGLEFVESKSQSNGQATITASFRTGTDPEIAAVDVQNRLKRVEARLPQAVRQQGVQVNKASNNFLMIITLSSSDSAIDPVMLGDYLSRNVIESVRRIPGVGQAQLFGSERAMRVWVDPAKLVGLKLTPADITDAIARQNAQVAAGSIGGLPSPETQQIAHSVVVTGQLTTPEAFGSILLRANADGSVLRLRDVARVEFGGQDYAATARVNGRPLAAIGVQLTPTGNALATADAIRAKLDELKTYFPEGYEYDIPYDSSSFVRISIKGVIVTLLEAIVLVFLVMYLFLQNLRATLIPTVVVPVALMGAFLSMLALGFSINVMTMFGLVLAIGILVDDAIVVVENVERIMREEGLPPREATRKAMGQITGAIVGITLVLTAVFIPMAFFGGSVGAIYQQFSLSMTSSILFSALMALTLTPALCATLLKPITAEHHEQKTGFFGWFNRRFSQTTERYNGAVARILRRSGRYMLIYGALLLVLGFFYSRLPTSFLPVEDQGYTMTLAQLPPGASIHRTEKVVEQIEGFFMEQPSLQRIVAVVGFSFAGAGQNAALAFASLKDWSERGKDESASAIATKANEVLGGERDAEILNMVPPPIPELGSASGFALRLQDRGSLGRDQLIDARNQLVTLARQNPMLINVIVEGLEDAPQLQLSIDRDKASALGVSFEDINTLISTSLGSAYVNDFPNLGRQQRVIVQATAEQRMQPEDLANLYVRNGLGEMVALSSFTESEWVPGSVQLLRYNGFPSIGITGDAAPGYSTGQAMVEMERMIRELPKGVGYEWSGQSREEKISSAQAPALFALSFLAVFLCLAALYESWSIPAAVMLVVPLGVLGAVLAITLRGMPDDVYFKVGLIAIIGLAAKNAILIIEFAKDLQAEGKGLIEATLEAAAMRFRPIIMTSLAFILGVLPLVIASGAGSASQRAIGTAVMGGMIAATVLAVFLVPVFFVVVRRLVGSSRAATPPHAAAATESSHA